MRRKTIQLLISNGFMHALCDDGSIWRRVPGGYDAWTWTSVDGPPEDIR